MSLFRFDFDLSVSQKGDHNEAVRAPMATIDSATTVASKNPRRAFEWLDEPSMQQQQQTQHSNVNSLGYQTNHQIQLRFVDTNISTASPTTIAPGIYEGGASVWECSFDLVEYVVAAQNQPPNIVSPKRVLELGCGHGLPSIALMKTLPPDSNATTEFVLVDYNPDVIRFVTAINLHLNGISMDMQQPHHRKVKLGWGDWMQLPPQHADLILSAETLYNAQTVHDMVSLLVRHMTNNGMALVATKRYYFGMSGGGGSQALHDAITEYNNDSTTTVQPSSPPRASSLLHVETVQVIDTGIGNIREILKVQWKH